MIVKNNKKEIIDYSAIIVILLIFYIIDKIFDLNILFCPLYEFTGLYCPGCGITRMIESILKLDLYQAFRYNPLVFIIFPFLVLYFFCRAVEIIKNKYIFTNKINDNVFIILLIIVILFGILRNVPGFEFLLPTNV